MNKDTQKRKLRKLAALLDTVPNSKFDMTAYCAMWAGDQIVSAAFNPSTVPETIRNCGTSACALGHAPRIYPGKENEEWTQYTLRVFDIPEFTLSWDWMFSPFWDEYDNTASGAAKRIRYWCTRGVPINYTHPHKAYKDLYKDF